MNEANEDRSAIEKLLDGHRQFKENFATGGALHVQLAEEGQKPEVLWIGCSDSRVIPEQVTGAGPGELFVMRNIANLVPPYGTGGDAVGAVIEYALLDLQVQHVVICGHTACGGVRYLSGQSDLAREPHLARWAELARPAFSQVEASGTPEEERDLETIKANVLLQQVHLSTYPSVRDALRAGRVTLHAWLYVLRTGDLLAHDAESDTWVLHAW